MQSPYDTVHDFEIPASCSESVDYYCEIPASCFESVDNFEIAASYFEAADEF